MSIETTRQLTPHPPNREDSELEAIQPEDIKQQDIEQEDEWLPEPPPSDLIFDDGEPLESNRHRIAMNVLIEAVHQAYQGREDYFAGGNMFVYYSRQQVKNKDFKGPDFFVALDVDGTRERQGWVVWDEEGRYPDVIVELMSPSTASQDTGKKKQLYAQTFHTRDYFVYDPFNPDSLEGWHLSPHFAYENITPDERGWLWCASLGLWLGLWEGTILRETATWLRFYDPEGNLILLGTERAEQAESALAQERQEKEQERERAERAEAELQALRNLLQEQGIEPNS
ncbi:Uma2 family endonuclease [Spirulina subsalsa]|uniref:Uma2 family endonuclease n=1 Tax=Spirulina subsalsa TaxID=54311 RepID=UPI0002DC06F8|nr:Uma2 family endonuclease [Spirulina subsalsa]